MSCLAIGALSLRWFSSSDWRCRAIPLIVSCPIACEISDQGGSFETLLIHSRHTFSNGFSLGQLYWNNSVKLVAPMTRPNLSRSLDQAHAPFFVLSSRTITRARPAVIAASTAYSTLCPFRVAPVTISDATSAAVLFFAPGRISSITAAAMRSSADFPHCCDKREHILEIELEVFETPLLSVVDTLRIDVVEADHTPVSTSQLSSTTMKNVS